MLNRDRRAEGNDPLCELKTLYDYHEKALTNQYKELATKLALGMSWSLEDEILLNTIKNSLDFISKLRDHFQLK